ncbi:MAG: hypothetical protein CBD74_03905 [Saprospirales bacterium TMED214]|nr:MAG: hypothetical protein CBD74_03905 [Saprospirales bacterium TMED214]
MVEITLPTLSNAGSMHQKHLPEEVAKWWVPLGVRVLSPAWMIVAGDSMGASVIIQRANGTINKELPSQKIDCIIG